MHFHFISFHTAVKTTPRPTLYVVWLCIANLLRNEVFIKYSNEIEKREKIMIVHLRRSFEFFRSSAPLLAGVTAMAALTISADTALAAPAISPRICQATKNHAYPLNHDGAG